MGKICLIRRSIPGASDRGLSPQSLAASPVRLWTRVPPSFMWLMPSMCPPSLSWWWLSWLWALVLPRCQGSHLCLYRFHPKVGVL